MSSYFIKYPHFLNHQFSITVLMDEAKPQKYTFMLSHTAGSRILRKIIHLWILHFLAAQQLCRIPLRLISSICITLHYNTTMIQHDHNKSFDVVNSNIKCCWCCYYRKFCCCYRNITRNNVVITGKSLNNPIDNQFCTYPYHVLHWENRTFTVLWNILHMGIRVVWSTTILSGEFYFNQCSVYYYTTPLTNTLKL